MPPSCGFPGSFCPGSLFLQEGSGHPRCHKDTWPGGLQGSLAGARSVHIGHIKQLTPPWSEPWVPSVLKRWEPFQGPGGSYIHRLRARHVLWVEQCPPAPLHCPGERYDPPRTWERDFIWKQGLCRCDAVKGLR